MKNKVTADIAGMRIPLSTDLDPEEVELLALELTDRIEEILKVNRSVSKVDAALFLLLDAEQTARHLTEENAELKRKLETAELDLALEKEERKKAGSKKE